MRAHVLVGLFSLVGTLLSDFDLGTELANFLEEMRKAKAARTSGYRRLDKCPDSRAAHLLDSVLIKLKRDNRGNTSATRLVNDGGFPEGQAHHRDNSM